MWADELERTIGFYKAYHQANETLPVALVHGPSGSGKLRTVEALCARLSMHLCKVKAVVLICFVLMKLLNKMSDLPNSFCIG